MANRKKEIEVFSISLIDLISGALGVMSILFFAIIPEISDSGLISSNDINSNDKSKVKPISEEDFKIISLHILHKEINTIEYSADDNFSTDYFVDKDIVLHKTTIVLDEDIVNIEVTLNENDIILEGSKIVFQSNNKLKNFLFEPNEKRSFSINRSNFEITYN